MQPFIHRTPASTVATRPALQAYRVPTYYIGFDPGTGRSKASIIAADGTYLEQDAIQINSMVANGDRQSLLLRAGDEDASLSSVLRKDEHVVTYNGIDFYLGNLAEREGNNADNAGGAAERYFTDHSLVRLLGLSALLCHHRHYELRVITALPYSLYPNKEIRKKVKQCLEGVHEFTFDGEPFERQIAVKVGPIVPEGQGILASVTENQAETRAVIDIGFRTTDLIVQDANGLVVKYCDGRPLGLGQVADALIKFYAKKGRLIGLNDAMQVLETWQQGRPLPKYTGRDGEISEDEVKGVISRSLRIVGRNIAQFVSSKWGDDRVGVGGAFDKIYIAGGSSYYFESSVREILPNVQRPSDPELANARGCRDIAVGLETVKPTIWEREWD
jgi:hypothetical protein